MEKLDLIKLTLQEKVDKLNEMILQGKTLEAFEKFYAEDVVMQENEDELTVGKDACRKNEEAFVSNITEFRNATVESVLISDNISVVEWDFDYTHAEWGDRKYTQVAVQRWNNDGEIINEKFYYNN